jgi:tetratricopeptide (TPR) repeat protein
VKNVPVLSFATRTFTSLTALALSASIGLAGLASCGGGGGSELATAKKSLKQAEDIKAKTFIAKSQADIDKINKDASVFYRNAKTSLDQEVMKGSTSANIGEAWYLLGKVSKELNLSDTTMMAFKQAEQLLGKEKKEDIQMRSELGLMQYELWIVNINKAVESYNAATSEDDKMKSKAALQKTIGYLENCLTAKPENIDIVYGLLGGANIQMGDTARGIAMFDKYLMLNKPMLDALTSKGVTLKESRESIVQKLGAPAEAKSLPLPDKANPKPDVTMMFDKYTNLVAGKDMYVFYPKDKDKGTFLMTGFSTPPAAWSQQEKERDVQFDMLGFIQVAYNAYQNKNWDKAIQTAKAGLAIKPSEENLANLLPTLYVEGGKTDLALAEFKAAAEKNPNDKVALMQYGNMLSSLERTEDAIAQFDKALKIDPKYDLALYNIAVAYKNKAAAIQKDETKKQDDAENARKKDKKAAAYTADVNKYKPFLAKSAEYFEDYRKLPGKDRDAQASGILEQLLNVYDVLDDKPKYSKAASEFIGMQYANENNPRYFEQLGRIYGKQKNSAKVKESLDKADALRKAGAK